MRTLWRMVAERLLRNTSFTRKFPKELGGGRISVSPDASLKLAKYNAAFDPMLLKFADYHISEGDSVWDIGANVGVFSLAAKYKSKTGKVISIDPDPFLCDLMRRTARFPEHREFDWWICCAAISSQPGVTDLKIANRGRATNAIGESSGSSQMGGIREKISVPTLTLDDLARSFGAPDVIKIDTEGAENLVLQGAGQVLAESAPTLLIEVSKQNNADVTSRLKSLEYRFYDAGEGLWPGEAMATCATNTIAISNRRPIKHG